MNTRLSTLRSQIDKAAQSYYSGNNESGITDEEYDALLAELRQSAPDDERLTRVGQPYDPKEMRTKVKHNLLMGSLDNTEGGIDGYRDWYGDFAGSVVSASLKIDGSSIRLKYEDGVLVEAATRGNGEVGEVVTANIAKFINVPTNIPFHDDLDIRGEAILYLKEYKEIIEREIGLPFSEIPENQRSNPRNIGNGIICRDDGTDSEKMRFIAFDIIPSSPDSISQSGKLKILSELGFDVVEHTLCHSEDDLLEFYNSTLSRRDSLPFEIDGIVVILDSIEQQKRLVTDTKSILRPKYARAIKFPHRSNTTILKDVLLTVGHTGAIIPTAVLEEVRVGGVNVTHALLNNWDEIERLGVAVGDEVEVALAGDIIPKIIGVVNEGLARTSIPEPENCPSCGSAASRRSLGNRKSAMTYCTNPTCYKMMIQKIDHWIGSSKKGVGILGIGSTILRALWDDGVVRDPADLYTITVDGIKDIETKGGGRIGESRASEIVNNINSKRTLPLHIFLGSLGIELLGRRRVQLLQKAAGGRLDTIDQWLDDDNLSSLDIEGFGDIIKASVRDGIDNNRGLINKLFKVGVTVESEKMTQSSGSMSGVSFCFTGTRECISEVTALGATIVNSVAKSKPSPDYLVQKDPTSTSNKTRNAEANGHTRIISLDHLKKVLSGDAQLGGRSFHVVDDEPESVDSDSLASELLN
jgi:DNA ligase (NAD+)